MIIDESYNIHKKLNCIFPFFKSKWLCKRDIHNFQLTRRIEYIPEIREIFEPYLKYKKHVLYKYDVEEEVIWKCKCCGMIKPYKEQVK